MYPVDEAVDVYALEGITVLRRERQNYVSWTTRHGGSRRHGASAINRATVPFREGLVEGADDFVVTRTPDFGMGLAVYVPRYARTSVACAGSIVNATPTVPRGGSANANANFVIK